MLIMRVKLQKLKKSILDLRNPRCYDAYLYKKALKSQILGPPIPLIARHTAFAIFY